MAIYMKFDGIDGDVTASGFDKHIAVTSFQVGVGRGISMEAGRSANREVSRPSISEITITKYMDISSDELFNCSVTGDEGCNVEIKFVKTGKGDVKPFAVYKLEEALISGYSISCDSEGDPMETITLSFTKVELEYTPSDRQGKGKSAKRYGYDIAKACKL